jgi:deoxycytidylate deaminase
MRIIENIVLSKRQKRAVEVCIELAKQSKCYHRHGAVLINNGNALINTGINKGEFCSFAERFKNDNCWKTMRHAEVSACLNVPRDLTKGGIIFVIRLNSREVLRNSKPCLTCMAVMRYCGIKKVIYSNEIGGFSLIKL